MDALEYLTKEHDLFRTLFKAFETAEEADDSATMQQLQVEMFDAIKVHSAIEEEVFYPQAKEVGGEAEDLVAEGIEEHHVADVLMAEVEALSPDDDAWAAKLKVFIENVDHHAQEEESELFPKLRKAFGNDRLATMGEQLAQARKAKTGDPGPIGMAGLSIELDLTERTRDELYELAQDRDIPDRSTMTKDELVKALQSDRSSS